MTNRVPGSFLEEGYSATVDFDNETVKVIAVHSASLTTPATDVMYLDDVDVAARVQTEAVANPAMSRSGDILTFDADDPVFSAITGDPVDLLVYYIEEASEATSPILAVIDTATGLPFTPVGADVTIQLGTGGIGSIGSCG